MTVKYFDFGEENGPIRTSSGVRRLPRYICLNVVEKSKSPVSIFYRAHTIVEVTDVGPIWYKSRDKEKGTKLTESELRAFTFQVLSNTIYN